jgi:prepilin-type N-terminal cleavage/methylation domain-containing protein
MTMKQIANGRRGGFTLTELIIAMVLFAIVMGAATQAIVRQQRFYRGAGELIDMRTNLRQGVSLVAADLRTVYPADGDIYEWTRSKIGFRSITGSSLVCLKPTATTIVAPPLTLVQNNTLTTWLTMPVVGDSVMIYDENTEIGNADDVWRRYQLTGVSTVNGANACLPVSGYTVVADLKPSPRFTLSAPLSPTIVTGAPMRFYRRVDYGIYQAADSLWYLGASDCLPGRNPVCSSLQPMAGPYRPLAGATTSGLVLSYFDAAGVELDPAIAPVASVARIGMLVRGETLAPYGSANYQQDSVAFTVGLRNRN